MSAVVEAKSVTRSYCQGASRVHALRGVDLAVAPGEFVAVMGPSGSGQSTLLHLVGGLDRPDTGEVFVEGRSLADLDEEDLSVLRRRRIVFVLQFFNLLPTRAAPIDSLRPVASYEWAASDAGRQRSVIAAGAGAALLVVGFALATTRPTPRRARLAAPSSWWRCLVGCFCCSRAPCPSPLGSWPGPSPTAGARSVVWRATRCARTPAVRA